AARLDQIDRHRKAGRQAQQRAGILRDIGLIQREAQNRVPWPGAAGIIEARIAPVPLPFYAAVCRIVRVFQPYSLAAAPLGACRAAVRRGFRWPIRRLRTLPARLAPMDMAATAAGAISCC